MAAPALLSELERSHAYETITDSAFCHPCTRGEIDIENPHLDCDLLTDNALTISDKIRQAIPTHAAVIGNATRAARFGNVPYPNLDRPWKPGVDHTTLHGSMIKRMVQVALWMRDPMNTQNSPTFEQTRYFLGKTSATAKEGFKIQKCIVSTVLLQHLSETTLAAT